jgi:hypothetical protein
MESLENALNLPCFLPHYCADMYVFALAFGNFTTISTSRPAHGHKPISRLLRSKCYCLMPENRVLIVYSLLHHHDFIEWIDYSCLTAWNCRSLLNATAKHQVRPILRVNLRF